MRALVVAAAVSMRRTIASPGALLTGGVTYLIMVLVLSALWRAAAGANDGEVAGYTAVALTWYIAATEASTMSLNPRLIDETGGAITSGAIDVELARPVPVLWVRVASEVGRVLPKLVMLTALGTIASVVLSGGVPEADALLLALPALVLAVTCNLVLQHAYAGAAFWTRDTATAWFIHQKLVMILGGLLIPLEALPDGVQHVAMALPFSAMAYVPGRVASGHFEPWLLLVQVGWIVVVVAIAAAVFRSGERRIQSVGG
jgi:ABC-2 type transport system permease protein